ncbi:MAG: two-component system, NarL family, sensor histidine kinase BarA, partial [Humisphaera sp.]|nr:two-component system, NarL family, sensor histidine kinase BarA [Humisphaera sp.]
MPEINDQPDYTAAMQSWWARVPWYRRATARLGLQGKLIICFMVLLLATLLGSYYLFLHEARATMWHATCERIINVSQSLAMAAARPLEEGDTAELTRIASQFVKNDGVIGVAFSDGLGQSVTVASQDPRASRGGVEVAGTFGPRDMMQPRRVRSPLFGSLVRVTAPVVVISAGSYEHDQATRLVGYVTISLSEHQQEQAIGRIYVILALVGCIVLLLTFPCVYLLVYRIFKPIRQLVDATERIAEGDLDAKVAIDRPDLIGTLARSFNLMVRHVRKQREELADANRDLEDKIHHRTAQLEMANNRLSNEIAEKEDFLRAVSHDLSAPLRNISGMATMLLMKSRDKFDDEIIHRLERIQKNVEAETDLIAELLELSRIKTRRQKMEMIDVNDLVNDIGDVLENDLKSRGIELVIDNRLPVIQCERARLRQVFQNLVDNAIKYMGDKPAKAIHVGCDVRMTETEFYVRDTGIGIDPEDVRKVFFVFRRGKNTAACNVPGKGIGLASVKSIIETYNGTIWVESKLGVGSTFRFTINGKFVPSMAGPHAHEESKTPP